MRAWRAGWEKTGGKGRPMEARCSARIGGMLVVVAGLCAAVAPPARADSHWKHTPTAPGDWLDDANWINGVPAPGDQAYVDNGGMAMIAAGEAFASALYLGYFDVGSVAQAGGTNVVDTLYLGWYEPAEGGYILDDGDLYAGTQEAVGVWSKGQFVQLGGANATNELLLGWGPAAAGSYDLSGGSLTVRDGLVGSAGKDPELPDGGGGGLTGTGVSFESVGVWGTGTFVQSGGIHDVNRLYVGWGQGSVGTYWFDGGSLMGTYEWVGVDGAGTFLQTGGTNQASSLFVGDGAGAVGNYDIGGGSLLVGSLEIGRDGQGGMTILDGEATIAITDLLRFGPQSTFAAAPGSAIHLAGARVENASTDPVALAGLADLSLIFEGGADLFSDFEVAGADMGSDPTAWTDNFALGVLQLGGVAPGRIRLVDYFINQPAWADGEALYVDGLVVNAGAAIDLNGLNLYYLNGGSPKQFFRGDSNLDGVIGYLDVETLSAWYNQPGTWGQGDFDGDGFVGYLDVGVLSTNYGAQTPPGGAPQQTPEPAALATLAVGACLLFARRRRRK